IEANTVENLGAGQDWSGEGAKSLTMWFQGHPIADGTSDFSLWPEFSVTGRGRDIWNGHDEFYFLGLYPWEAEPLSTTTHIQTRVVSMDDTDPWAKAGLMIREKLTPYSKYAAVFVTPNNGITFQWRDAEGGPSGSATETSRTVPQYLKLERTAIGAYIASYSTTGDSWDWADVNVSEDPDVTYKDVPMDDPCLYAGVAVTSHDGTRLCTADFNNWDAYPWPSTWVWGDVGLNAPEQLYVALEDTVGNISVIEHSDVNAATLTGWQEWNVELTDFTTVNLNAVKKVRIGLGDRVTKPGGGTGALYIDDIRACPPRCIPAYVKPLYDIAQPYDCIVDEKDLRVLAGDWLLRDELITTVAPDDANLVAYWPLDIDFLDYSGNGFNGDPNGDAELVTDANRVKVLRLYSDGDFVNCGNPTDPCALDFGTGNWTVSAWFKTTMSGTGDENKGVIYAKGGDRGGGHRYALYVNEEQGTQGRITLVTDDNVNKRVVNSSVIVNDGDWHHVVGLRDVNDLRVYIDGLPDGTISTVPTGYDLSGTHQHNAYIGVVTNNSADPNGTVLEKWLQGSIDDVRIYDYALSSEEAAYLAVDGAPGLHLPIPSPAEVYDGEAPGSQWINLKDYSLITGSWLEKILWP
ncbi:MAG: LamG domain-containing protein, partial [Planctomycetota bacterium]